MIGPRPAASIQRRLLAAMMGTSLAILLLACAVFFAFEIVSVRRDIAKGLGMRARIVAANSSAVLAFRDESAAAEMLAALFRDPRIRAAALYDEDGRLFVRHPEDAPESAFPDAPGSPGSRIAGGACTAFQPVAQGSLALGTVYLRSDLAELTARYRFYAVVVGLVLAFATLVAFALASWLQRRIARPILELAGIARRVSMEQDYSLRAVRCTDDEIGLVADAFNGMLHTVQESEEGIRRLNADLERRVRERTVQLEASNRELEAFSYSVSHDLRAPLRAIDGFGKALLEHAGDRLDETGSGYLRRIRAATQRMGGLIDDLLTLARLTTLEMRRRPVDLSDVAREIADELQQAQPERAVDFAIEDGLVAEGDPQLLRVAVENLLRNAWKYTSRHDTARIEMGREHGPEGGAYFVRDDGAGFDMAYSSHLFAPFQRLHRQTEFEGTGVGLATVQRIIRRHGGRVWANGEVDKGAVFRFTLWEGADHG